MIAPVAIWKNWSSIHLQCKVLFSLQQKVWSMTDMILCDGFKNITIWHNLWWFSSYCHGLGMGSYGLHQWACALWQFFASVITWSLKRHELAGTIVTNIIPHCNIVKQKTEPNNQVMGHVTWHVCQDNHGPCVPSINLKRIGLGMGSFGLHQFATVITCSMKRCELAGTIVTI